MNERIGNLPELPIEWFLSVVERTLLGNATFLVMPQCFLWIDRRLSGVFRGFGWWIAIRPKYFSTKSSQLVYRGCWQQSSWGCLIMLTYFEETKSTGSSLGAVGIISFQIFSSASLSKPFYLPITFSNISQFISIFIIFINK